MVAVVVVSWQLVEQVYLLELKFPVLMICFSSFLVADIVVDLITFSLGPGIDLQKQHYSIKI